MGTSNKSIEEIVEDWAKRELDKKPEIILGKSTFTQKGQNGTLQRWSKTESVNSEIDAALAEYPSKEGGKGGNRPDIKAMINTADMRHIPVMIEVKGKKGDLIKADKESGMPLMQNKKGEPLYKNIAAYAVNGALHYAQAILTRTESYKEVLAVGVNGYETPTGETEHEVSLWYVSTYNLFVPRFVGNYHDLSILLPEHQAQLIEKIDNLGLSEEEIEKKKLELEDEIEKRLKALNQKMQDEANMKIAVGQRVQLITGLVMAALGVPGKISPLKVDDLRGEQGHNSNDGKIIMNKITDYLSEKRLPREKIEMIEGVLAVVFLNSKLQEAENGGQSKLRTIYAEVRHSIMPFLSGELHNLDFTGRLFNVLNEWVDVPDGAENDVVLTPRAVTELMAELCQVGMDSYVWDFATGSAGFLISAMHRMIADAKNRITEPAAQQAKITHIKMHQLLGIEKLADIYMLAVLNMILMKDGSANIIHGDSLKDFKGEYEQGEDKGKPFPANVFLLNPPYSAEGKGMVFVERALSMMTHGGMAAVLIQENAGSGKGLPYTANILGNNTLVASIHMADIFCGKANVQTAIYVFKVGTPHDPKSVVKFIDFSNDGYTRTNRKKSSQSVNLRDTDNARDRYAEIVKLVTYGRGINNENLNYFTGHYEEDYITLSGTDWTYKQHQKIDTTPKSEDFANVVKDYMAWQVSEIIRKEEDSLGK